jgi:hypothetical protein
MSLEVGNILADLSMLLGCPGRAYCSIVKPLNLQVDQKGLQWWKTFTGRVRQIVMNLNSMALEICIPGDTA